MDKLAYYKHLQQSVVVVTEQSSERLMTCRLIKQISPGYALQFKH